MIKKTIKKILPKKTYDFLKKIIIRPKKINYYSSEEIKKNLNRFGVRKFSILTDGQTETKTLFNLTDAEIGGVYSFDLDVIGRKISGFEVKPILPDKKIQTDGWIVSALNKTASFSLNKYLLESGQENQTIIQHVIHEDTTKYYSYVDFFSNDQKTLVHINNYFRRLYALPFPLDLRLTLRDCSGKIAATKQIIIPSGAIRVIKSQDFPIKNFTGYMELEFEIAKKVTPFLHYMVDYIAPDFISSNHQSGLGLHPAGSEFTRGFIPKASDESLEVCLFQKNYDAPITVKAILHYVQDGKENVLEKNFPPLGKNEMLYVDAKKLFSEIDFTKTQSAYIVTKANVPLHRPNYYYLKKGKKGYFDTSHAGPDLKNHIRTAYKGEALVTKEEKEKFKSLNLELSELNHYIFPEEAGIESLIALGNDSTFPVSDFEIKLYDTEGLEKASFKEHFDFEKTRYVNLNEYLNKKGVLNFTGTLSLHPASESVPISLNSVVGFRSKKPGYVTSTAGNGASPDNIPFYFRGGPPNYFRMKSSAGVTDIFSRGISSEEFDTFFLVSYQSAAKNIKKMISYEIEILNSDGQRKILNKKISSHGLHILKLSELVEESNHRSSEGFYTVWIFSSEAHIYAQHLLIRKKDSAIALEHFYAGRFGV